MTLIGLLDDLTDRSNLSELSICKGDPDRCTSPEGAHEPAEDVFPPKTPCPPNTCFYGDKCGGQSWSDPGCGACCGCYNTCHLEYDISQAYIPETPEQYKLRLQADALWKNFKPVKFA